MKSIQNIFLLLLFVSLAACENDNNVPINEITEQGDTNPFLENFGSDIQARFIGTVVNEQNNPVVGAEIKIGVSSVVTDANGVFSIQDATVFEKFAYITATKGGFVDGSRALVPTTGVNQVKIMLLRLEPLATVLTGQALTIDLPDGTEVDLPADFEDEFRLPYVGNVSINIKTLNINDNNMFAQMPGSLLAENSEGALRVLQTYGMLSVELRGENNKKLNIASGAMATLRIPVGSNATNLPATLPLWFFDADNGYWKEEGFAELVNGKYVGRVSHFGFWNCDIPFETVDFCATLVDINDAPITNTFVQVTSDIASWSKTITGWTDSSGLICGLIPANEALTLTIPDFGCLNNSVVNNLGPYSDNQNITLVVSDVNSLSTTFTATLNNCNGNEITNGYLQFVYNSQAHIVPVTDAVFSEFINYCATDTAYSVKLIDAANNQSSNIFTSNFISPTTNFGMQMSCNTLGDADSDGVLDVDEDINANNNFDDDDTDSDGIPNYLDDDDDGDGIITINEDANGNGDPTDDDTDGDGIPDYLDNN